MSEVITNKYLDFGGLKKYDELIKVFIANGNKELADAISALNDKIGSLEIEGSDDKTIAESIAEIYASIEEIVVKQGALEDKDAELEGKDAELLAQINGIIGELEEGATAMTLVEIANKFKTVEEGIEKNAGDIAGVDTRLTTLEETVRNLGEIEGGESLGDIVNKVNTNADNIATLQGAVETLNGEGEGSVKKTAEDAAAAAEEAAKEYADSLVMDGENPRFDEAGAAATAQAAAEAYADEKAGAAETNAKAYADGLVTDAEGKSKFDVAGAAAQALADAKSDAADLYQVKGDYESAGAAAQALVDAKAYVDAIAHASDVKYEEGFIKLYDAEGKVIGNGFDASPFIVDGMLDTVDFVKDENDNATTTLRFTFNVEDSENKKKTIDVDFSEYVDTYHADGTSLSLDSATNTFSIKEVAADKTKLNSDITIAGGPLANNITETGDEWPWTDSAGNKIIPQGKSMEEILTGLFLKVNEGTVSFGNPTWSPGVAQPTVTLSKSGTIEVGTKVKVTALSKGNFNKAKRSVTLTTTEGYFDGDTYYLMEDFDRVYKKALENQPLYKRIAECKIDGM